MANTLNLGNGNWATKEDSLLAYNSENGNFKPLPFDFTRASSATVVNKAGLIETVGSGEPRIDFSNDAKGALLLEPTRSNFITYSNGFTDSSWFTTGSTVVSGVISPDGTSNAFTLSNTASSGIIQKAVSITGTRVLSIFAKKGTHRYLRMGAYAGTSSYANFDLENGVVADGANANIEYYGNGWYRCTCHSVSGTTGGVQIFPSNNTTGAATTNGSIQIYGVHLQQASTGETSPTSYIPTQGSAVTRVADACNNGGNEQVINSTEGVLYAEFKNTDTSNYKLMSISDGTGNNRVFVGTRLNNGYIYYFVVAGGTTQASYISTQLADNFTKVAVKFKANDFSFWINGLKVSTDLSGSVPIGLNVIQFNGGSGTLDFNGNVKDVRVYNTALTDTELQALTT